MLTRMTRMARMLTRMTCWLAYYTHSNSNTSTLFPVKTSLFNLVHHNLPPVCQTTHAISFNQEV